LILLFLRFFFVRQFSNIPLSLGLEAPVPHQSDNWENLIKFHISWYFGNIF